MNVNFMQTPRQTGAVLADVGSYEPVLEVSLRLSAGLQSALRVLGLFAPFEDLLKGYAYHQDEKQRWCDMILTLTPSRRSDIIVSKIEALPFLMSSKANLIR